MRDADVGHQLAERIADAVRARFAIEFTPEESLVRPAAPGRGADYQSNAAMGLARRVGSPSRDVALAIAERLDAADLVEQPAVAGPGFVNLTLRREWLERRTAAALSDPRLCVPLTDTPARYVVDLSGPNIAKEMHVGHLRSTVIGDALARLVAFAGHEVTRRNHLGDWGTPFGMLIEHLADEGGGTAHRIGDLDAFYRAARARFDTDPAFAARARSRVVALHAGDPATRALWRDLVAESERHFQRVYELAGVALTPEDSYGESFYNPYLAGVVDELTERGLVGPSEGALCAFPPGFTGRDGGPLPLIVRKSDGGYTYAATDLAAVRYWVRERGATDLVYVVGAPQRQHFAMVFEVARLAGWLDGGHRAVHVPFGSVLGEDGRMLRSRAGDSVKLVDLLLEATARAGALVAGGPGEAGGSGRAGEAERERLARAVGIGAVKYADLSSDRERDYVFSWPRMLSLDGDTSVYLQYANARIGSVLRRAGGPPAPDVAVSLTASAERALAVALARLPAALAAATGSFEPHRLCGYLHEVATAFSAFYESCPILAAGSGAARDSRLALAALTSRTLVLGLDLLGIEAPERM